MRRTARTWLWALAFVILAFLAGQVMAGEELDETLDILSIEAPGCGNGGTNYFRETTTHDPLDIVPDLSMEPMTSVSQPGTKLKAQDRPDILCIDSFEREADDVK